ncbi:MAG: response regulator [Spirochaetes bacterium]|nr:response regulator [Spirochaetota bacterium]
MEKHKILIAEDNTELSIIIQNQLAKIGYDITGIAATGIETINIVKKKLPDIILMDIMLKGDLDGIETASIILKQFDIPIVFLTGNTTQELIEKAKIIGAYGYLVKPIKKQDLQTTIEITLHKHKLDKQIKINEALYRGVVEDQTELITRYSNNFKLTFVNEAFCKFYNKSRENLIGKNLINFIHKEDRDLLLNNIKSITNENSYKSTEHRIVLESGEIRWQHRIDRAIFLSQNNLIEYQSVSRDITEKKKAEDLLKIQRDLALKLTEKTGNFESKLSECLDAALKISDMDCGGIYLIFEDTKDFNLVKSKGFSPDFIENSLYIEKNSSYYNFIINGKPIYTTFKKIKFSLIDAKSKQGLKGMAVLPLSFNDNVIACIILISKKFEHIPSTVKHALETLSMQISNLIIYAKAEDNLIEEKEFLSTTLKSISDGVISTDIKGNIILFNKAAEEITGYHQSEAIDTNINRIFKINDNKDFSLQNIFESIIKQTEINYHSYNSVLINKNNLNINIEFSVSTIRDKNKNIQGAVIVFKDITKKLIYEEEIKKAHKLESLGVLAGGIAHDFNNYMTCILGNISLAMSMLGPYDKTTKFLSDAEKAVIRSRDLAQQLLTFAKGGLPIKKTTSIKEIIQESSNFVLKGSNINILISIPDDLYYVEIDIGQINQVFNNLILNSMQAMKDGGTINILGENIEIDNNTDIPMKKGKFVKITIMDQGCGIPANIKDKIFDPYFSLNKNGNGLGLAICYSIIKKHNGFITFESQIKKGSSFHIYLPASEKNNIENKENDNNLILGNGKILIMDDEEIVTTVLANMLNHLGYKFTIAKDGQETIEKYLASFKNNEPYDIILMDLTIPGGMGGKKTVQEILKINSSAKVIVTSGYSNDPIMSNFKNYGFIDCIVKPYKISTLSSTINRVLKN